MISAPTVSLRPFADARSPTARRSRARIALATLLGLVLLGLVGPPLLSLLGAPGPSTTDISSLSPAFGTPTGPSLNHLFGVDSLGRDILSRVVSGTRVSLSVAFAAAGISLLVGVTLGMIAGYRGGRLDTLISRLIETFLVIPYLLLAIGIASSCSTENGCLGGTLTPGVPLVVLVISMATWPVVARVVRNQTLAIRNTDYVLAARISGLSQPRILFTEVLPNLTSSILVFAVILVPYAIFAEAALSFLGVGLPASTASWGSMISDAAPLFPESWWAMVFPGLALAITVLCCTVAADYLRDSNPSKPVGI